MEFPAVGRTQPMSNCYNGYMVNNNNIYLDLDAVIAGNSVAVPSPAVDTMAAESDDFQKETALMYQKLMNSVAKMQVGVTCVFLYYIIFHVKILCDIPYLSIFRSIDSFLLNVLLVLKNSV